MMRLEVMVISVCDLRELSLNLELSFKLSLLTRLVLVPGVAINRLPRYDHVRSILFRRKFRGTLSFLSTIVFVLLWLVGEVLETILDV